MRKLSTAFLIAGVAIVVALTGCGGGGGGGSTTPPVVTPGQVIITGTVRDNRSGGAQPVAGVLVKLNNVVVATNASGQFSFTLPNPPSVQMVPQDAYFYVSTRTLSQTDYPVEYGVIYLISTPYSQSATTDGAKIPIPSNVYNTASGTVSLGTITVKYNDPSGPPGPPDM